jgi:hypothetical protein
MLPEITRTVITGKWVKERRCTERPQVIPEYKSILSQYDTSVPIVVLRDNNTAEMTVNYTIHFSHISLSEGYIYNIIK